MRHNEYGDKEFVCMCTLPAQGSVTECSIQTENQSQLLAATAVMVGENELWLCVMQPGSQVCALACTAGLFLVSGEYAQFSVGLRFGILWHLVA